MSTWLQLKSSVLLSSLIHFWMTHAQRRCGQRPEIFTKKGRLLTRSSSGANWKALFPVTQFFQGSVLSHSRIALAEHSHLHKKSFLNASWPHLESMASCGTPGHNNCLSETFRTF